MMFHLLFVICFITLSVTQNINIVEQKSLVCFVDEVQFTISKDVNGKKITTKNGKCSKIIGSQRLITFNYKNCGVKIVYLEPYGPLTKMDFVLELSNGETSEFGTQCFFDDTVGWSPIDDINTTNDDISYQLGYMSSSEIRSSLIDAELHPIKSASVGERVSFTIQVSDPNYKSMLPYDCKFSKSKNVDDSSDVQFVKDGCPIKFNGFMDGLARDSSMSYTMTFNSFQIDSKRRLYIKCSIIKLCTSINNPKCNNVCYSTNATRPLSNLTTARKYKLKLNKDVDDKIVWFRDSFEVTNCTNMKNNNGVVLTLALIIIMLVLTIIFGLFMIIRMKKNQRKVFKVGHVSRSLGVCAYR